MTNTEASKNRHPQKTGLPTRFTYTDAIAVSLLAPTAKIAAVLSCAHLDPAAARRLGDPEPVRNGLLHDREMRDEPHGTVAARVILQGFEYLQGTGIALRVEASESLVDEDGVETDVGAGVLRRHDQSREVSALRHWHFRLA
jgi:hypothetical protein